MKVRRLNEIGQREFEDFIIRTKNGEVLDIPIPDEPVILILNNISLPNFFVSTVNISSKIIFNLFLTSEKCLS